MLNDNFWALVKAGEIALVIDGLPSRWCNIRDMHALLADELADLSWAGHAQTGFVKIKTKAPTFDPAKEYLEGPEFKVEGPDVWAVYKAFPRRELNRRQQLQAAVRGISLTRLDEQGRFETISGPPTPDSTSPATV